MKKTEWLSWALIMFIIVGAVGVAFDTPSRTILISSNNAQSPWTKYNNSNNSIQYNGTAYIGAGLYVCDTGVETILTRNKTLAEFYGCSW